MHTMYPSLAKLSSFPLVARVSSKPRCITLFHVLKSQSLPIKLLPKPYLNPTSTQLTKVSEFHCKAIKMRNVVRYGSVAGFLGNTVALCCVMLRAKSRGFSSYTQKRSSHGAAESLPSRGKKERGTVNRRVNTKSVRSSWTESVERLEGVRKTSSFDGAVNRVDKGISESIKRSETGAVRKIAIGTVPRRNNKNMVDGGKGRRGIVGSEVVDQQYEGLNRTFEGEDEEIDEQEEDLEVVDDPRWDRIRNKFGGMVDVSGKKDKLEFQRWNKQESWGRKVWREAGESSVPKMVGEAVYGVGPVLAALSAGRREFYALYVQEGLDLSGKNRKKKDKMGFEKILKMTETVELNIKEVSKHDLNMAVNNRPHQGLVLDASPLELVKIKELDPVVPDEEENLVWVALDEVTDPQNLGAIIRSAYFFGVTGVILCAKNSAPLSGVVSKASAGSLEVMELRYCKNMMQFLVSSAENGWRVIGGSVSSKAVPLSRILPGVPTILVLGSEGTGLRPLVERSCTQLVKIPGNIPSDMASGEGTDDAEAKEIDTQCSTEDFRLFLAVESLNVSVAAGVLLNHLIGNNQLDNQLIGDNSAQTHD